MQRIFTYWRIYVIIRRVFSIVFFTFFGLFIVLFLLLQIPSVQNWAGHKATTWLSEKLNTRVELKRINVNIFDHLVLEQLYIEDQHQDTLLFAGKFEVNIGTINPFNSYVKVKSITLSDSYIHLSRTVADSTYNYAFIADAFSSHDTTTIKDTTASTSKPVQFHLNRISINNSRFLMHDEVGSTELALNIDESDILINTIDLEEQVLALEKIEFDKTEIKFHGLFDTIPSNKPDSYDTVHLALGKWDVEAAGLILKDCSFSYHDDNSHSTTTGLNFGDIAMQNIQLDMSDIVYAGDSIFTTINNIALKDKSGFEVDSLAGNLLFSPYEITLTNLLIKTPQSRIQNGFGFSFNTLNDFDRFNSDVRMHADLNKSIISSKDIAYFVPEIADYTINLELSSRIFGSLDNLKARDFVAVIPNTGSIKGEINVKGLPNIDETFIDIQFDPLTLNTQSLNELTGSDQIPQKVLSLGSINYKGRVTGFVYDLVAFGDLQTDQGGIYTDLNFKYDPQLKSSAFSGTINTTALNAGLLLNEQDMLGKVSMDATVDGKILSDNSTEFNLTANIQQIEFNQYNYTNIKVDGELKNKFFQGNFAIDDPNAMMNFTGIINFSDSLPEYNFTTTIKRMNLQPLHLYDQPLVFSSTATLHASGKNIDDMTGVANLSDVYLIEGRNIYRLDTLALNSSTVNGKKHITAKSTLIDFDITGNYQVTKLPAAIKNMVSYYTTGKTDSTLAAQSADYTISVKNADRLTAIFYPDVQVVRNLTISGNFNTQTKEFNSRLRVDEFNYKSYTLDTLLFEARTDQNKLEFFTRINSSYINAVTKIPVVRIEGSFAQNNLDYNLKVGKDTDADRINLNGGVAFEDSLVALGILPSEIYFRNEKWDILPNNSLKIAKNNLIAENFTLNSGDRSISLTSVPDPTYTTVLKLNVKNIPIGELAETYVLPGESVTGTLDATYSIGNIMGKPSFVGGAEIRALTLNDKLLGNLKINTSMIQPSNHLKFNAFLSGDNGFTADGLYTFEGDDSLTVAATFTNTSLTIAEPFLRGILSEMQGDVSGKLSIAGPVKRPEMQGNLTVKKGGAKIDYMGVNYFFDGLQIGIDKNKITIPTVTITDKLNNKGTLSGEIAYSNFSNWNFKSLHLVTSNMILMDTEEDENPDFYGYVVGAADVNITGKLDKLLITVNTTPHSNSIVNLPTYGSGGVKKHDFIRFVNRTDTNTIQKSLDELNLSIVDVKLILNATPDMQIKLLINPEKTEYLMGKGYGVLTINANSLGEVKMNGDYKITEGLYDFSFQGLFERPFSVVPGSVISFSGSPYNAKLSLTAKYVAKDVPISTLVTTSNEKTDVNVLIGITGTLEAPQIDFDIDVPKSNVSSNTDFQRRIQEIKADKNELNKQVFGLLITNSFLPQDLTTFNAVGTTANSTMNDFVSSQLTTYFQNMLNDFLKNTEVDIDYDNIKSGTYNYTTDQGKQFVLDVTREVTNNLIIKVGTTYYDFASGNSAAGTSNIAGDFEVEYLLSEDGRIRVKAFRVSEYDAIIAKNDVKTGVGLYYTKEFDSWKELFQRKKKAEPASAEPQ